MRMITPLNFGWRFAKKEEGMLDTSYDDALMEEVDIPHSNVILPYNNFSDKLYQFESVYRKTINVDKKTNLKYYLRFEGILHKSVVYVNSHQVRTHDCGYTAFEMDVTDQISDGANTIIVDVDSRETLNQPPFGKTIDYLTYGGIYREVYLIEKPLDHIVEVNIASENLLTNPKLQLDVLVSGGSKLEVSIFDKKALVYLNKYHVGEKIVIEYPFELWNIDHPKLYHIKVTLDQNDVFSFKTGFRQIEYRKNGFYLNGDKVIITGLNRHQIYPYVGYAMPKSAQVKDAEILKTFGNAVRTSHYPQSKHFIDACDRLGILVFMEAPGWQHIGNEEWKESYLRSVKDMIEEHKHHPSIILWGVRINESGDDNKLYTSSNKLAKSIDKRPTGGARCFSFSEELEDVYTYNDFFHNGKNNYLKNIDEVIETDIPYLITEFNGHMYPTKSFDHPERMIEHAMRYAHILNEYRGNNRIMGGFGWQLIDYYTHNQFGSGDHICYHGILDTFRLAKPAARIYESQEAKEPYLELLHSTDIGDYDCGYIEKFYIATNCEYIDLYQNERYVSRFYPDTTQFPHLKYAPVIVDDLYGNAYSDIGISEEDAKEYKNLANFAAARGGLDKITKQDNIDLEKLKIAWDMYGKYVANWGSESFTYRFVGSFKGVKIDKVIGPYDTYDYHIKVDKPKLIIDETYDVTRITIEAIDNLGNLRPYAFDAVEIKVNGSIELIGDHLISLIGGKRAVWVKTKNEGKGFIEFSNKSFRKIIEIEVFKKALD